MTSSFRVKSLPLTFVFVVVAALLAVPAAAQSTARIEGIVTDNTGAALPGATVTATNVETNVSRVTVSDRDGAYSITALPVGDYRVQVDLSGFRPSVTPVTLTVNYV